MKRLRSAEGVSIQSTAGLHKAIGRWLIARPTPLNGAELRFLRTEMELTQRDLAGIIGAQSKPFGYGKEIARSISRARPIGY